MTKWGVGVRKMPLAKTQRRKKEQKILHCCYNSPDPKGNLRQFAMTLLVSAFTQL